MGRREEKRCDGARKEGETVSHQLLLVPQVKREEEKDFSMEDEESFPFFPAVTHGGSTCSNKKRGNP